MTSSWYHRSVRFLAGGLGLGYAPVAPGTFGTVLGSVLFYAFRQQNPQWWLRFAIVFALVSVALAHLAEKSYGKKDCGKIVIDEVAGVLLCYAFVPYSTFHLVLGFILFRLFDVAKIFPARWAQDNLPGGLGVVADDLVAGLQSALVLLGLPHMQRWTEGAITWWRQILA